MVISMKISEARQLYGFHIREYNDQKAELSKKKQKLEEKININSEDKKVYENEAAVLELTINALDEKQEEYRDYMNKLSEQWAMTANMVSTQNQSEAAEEYAEDMSKIMEVARRLMKGDIVPATDEKKLMEYSMEMYQTAKNMGAMAQQRERKKYDSLWDDEEKDNTKTPDPIETADNTEAFAPGPEVVAVAEMMGEVKIEG